MRVPLFLKSVCNLASLRLVAVGIVFTFVYASVITASTDVPFVSLRLHRSETEVLQYQAYPESRAKVLFPSSDAWVEGEEDPHNLGLSASPIIAKIRIFKVGDAGHRFTVIAASVDDQLFIFDALFCRDNSAAMRELIRAARLFAKTSAEARNGRTCFWWGSSEDAIDLGQQEGFEEGDPACAWSAHT